MHVQNCKDNILTCALSVIDCLGVQCCSLVYESIPYSIETFRRFKEDVIEHVVCQKSIENTVA